MRTIYIISPTITKEFEERTLRESEASFDLFNPMTLHYPIFSCRALDFPSKSLSLLPA
jgi:hypothetical protein